MAVAVVDTGPLVAAVDADDASHDSARATLNRADLELVIPALVVAEAFQLTGSRLGASAEAGLARTFAHHSVEAPSVEDWERIAELVDRYADLPLGGVDASVVALAERIDAPIVITLDRRHFTVVRPEHREAFELLP